ncbi:putative flavin reductase [Xylogone sp. PMI_703]|nr:putative flavin reductase [Xylogone sp. PMI_703]
MHILVIGGSGQTGKLVIRDALQRGHTVTALVRNPDVVAVQQGLTLIKGTPLVHTDVENAFTSIDGGRPMAVIVTLASPREKGVRMMADAHLNLISAMKKNGISKIATMSSFGTGSSLANISIVMRAAIEHTKLGYTYADHNLVDKEMKESGLNFVLARPTRLTNGEKAPIKFFDNDGAGMGALAGIGGISRASVASFLVDAVENNTWDRSTPVISN